MMIDYVSERDGERDGERNEGRPRDRAGPGKAKPKKLAVRPSRPRPSRLLSISRNGVFGCDMKPVEQTTCFGLHPLSPLSLWLMTVVSSLPLSPTMHAALLEGCRPRINRWIQNTGKRNGEVWLPFRSRFGHVSHPATSDSLPSGQPHATVNACTF